MKLTLGDPDILSVEAFPEAVYDDEPCVRLEIRTGDGVTPITITKGELLNLLNTLQSRVTPAIRGPWDGHFSH